MIIALRAVLITCAALLFAQPVHAVVALAAHRAVYDLGLLKSSGAKAPIQAHGRIVLEFSGSACEGYVQNFRQITDMQPPEGASKLSDMTAATFEAGDGESFRFKTQTRIESAIVENVDGRARKREGGVEVSFEKSKKAPVNIAAPTFFPTEHLRRVLTAARAGDKMLEARVFDGAGDFASRCNLSMVDLEPVRSEELAMENAYHQTNDLAAHGRVDIMSDMTRYDAERLRHLIANHLKYTGSTRAREILDDWENSKTKFVKVMPVDYRRALNELAAASAADAPVARARVGHG